MKETKPKLADDMIIDGEVESGQAESLLPALSANKLKVYAGTFQKVIEMLQTRSVVADGQTELHPPSVENVLVAQQFMTALYNDAIEAFRAADPETAGPDDDAPAKFRQH